MSSGSQQHRAETLKALARELRQFTGLGATLYRVAAGRLGMTVTDMQVIDALDSAGPLTAGQLADVAGLTTGAITGMLNRLEEAGLVRRERDPEDGRRIIVQLATDKETLRDVGPIFASFERSWEAQASRYDDEQVALLLAFLKQSNATSRNEIARLRETSEGDGGVFTGQLGELESARLVVSSGFSRLSLRANDRMAELYQARFEGPTPSVKVRDGEVSIRFPRRLWMLDGTSRVAEVALNAAIPWRIAVQGGASEIIAELGGLDLAGLEVKGGMNTIRLELPAPSGVVPVHIGGGASEIVVRRPAGVAARVHLKGWVSTLIFDDQMYSNMGNDVRLVSRDFEAASERYEIEVSSSASMITITTD